MMSLSNHGEATHLRPPDDALSLPKDRPPDLATPFQQPIQHLLASIQHQHIEQGRLLGYLERSLREAHDSNERQSAEIIQLRQQLSAIQEELKPLADIAAALHTVTMILRAVSWLSGMLGTVAALVAAP